MKQAHLPSKVLLVALNRI